MNINNKKIYSLYGKKVIAIINGKPEIVRDFGGNNSCMVQGVFSNITEYTEEKWKRIKKLSRWKNK